MQDPTTGSVTGHLLKTTSVMLVSMVFQTLYVLVDLGDEYLRISSWNFVASALIFVTGSMFQAMGNTMPSLVTPFTRIVVVAIPAFVLSRMPGFEMRWIWYLSVLSVTVQMCLNLMVLQRECRDRLTVAART
jgi:Na+-driven multidrug efflux pump